MWAEIVSRKSNLGCRGENEGEKEGATQGQLGRQLPGRQTQNKTHRMKEKSKAPRQNIDEEKQVKLSYKS